MNPPESTFYGGAAADLLALNVKCISLSNHAWIKFKKSNHLIGIAKVSGRYDSQLVRELSRGMHQKI